MAKSNTAALSARFRISFSSANANRASARFRKVIPFRLVYHPGYNLDLGAHVFPARKYRLIRDRLLAEGVANPADILEPQPASDEDVLRVHAAEYVHKLKTGTLSATEQMRLELPFSQA